MFTLTPDNNYKINHDEYFEIQSAIDNIEVWLDIMADYCEYNVENEKVCPLITLLEQVKSEMKKVTEHF